MPEAITRIYSSTRKAKDAAAELRRRNCVTEDVTIVTPRDTPDAPVEEIVAALLKAGLSRAHAEHYAEFVRQGGTAVSVQPPWGKGVVATQILLSHGPIAGTAPAAPVPAASAHTLPARVGEEELTRDAAPLSRFLNMPVLTRGRASLSQRMGWRELIDSPTPLSSWLGMRVLSADQRGRAGLLDDPAPLSRRLGMRELSEHQTGRSQLRESPTPLSTWLGLKVLSNDPAPLSRAFNLPVLKE